MDKSFWVAIIALLGTLITVIISNATLAWSKWLDVKQKQNDHKLSLRTVYLSNKIKAAENAVSKWTVALNYYSALEQYGRGFNPDTPLAEEFSTPIDALLKRLGDAVSDAASEGTAFLLYFDAGDDFWSNDISDVLFAQYSIISGLMLDIKMIDKYLEDHTNISKEEKGEFVEERERRIKEMADILRDTPGFMKIAKDRLLAFVKNVSSQLKEYESI